MLKDSATDVVRQLNAAGHQAYLVGGCVRDLLLGREPEDFDVATDATPDEVMHLFPETYAVGAKFGVVLVPVSEKRETRNEEPEPPTTNDQRPTTAVIEVATFRSDGLYSDGRRPDQVTYTKDPKQDVQRRDFTINGLLLDPM